MNATLNCSHCSAPLVEGESDALCPVCLLTVGLSQMGDANSAAEIEAVGRYQLLEQIGQGGMGQVYKARDSQLGRIVAIKFLPKQLAESSENLKRFQREAATLSRVSHPNVCIVYDVGHSDRGPYIVMEYVRGQSLSAILDTSRLTIEQSLDAMLQICAGIEVIHEKGIIHRDIKPSNVMLTDRSIVKLVDFGLAKWSVNPDLQSTRHADAKCTRADFVKTIPGQVIGTPSYMSPEQAAGTAVDVRSDIFSLGALFYGMLTGEPPFLAETPMLAMHSIISRNYRPIREANPELPKSLEAIVDRMLGDLDERFQSIAEIVPLLQQARLQFVATTGTSAPAKSKVKQAPHHNSRKSLFASVMALAGLLLLVTLAWSGGFFSGWTGSEEGQPNRMAISMQRPPISSDRPPSDLPINTALSANGPVEHHMVTGVVVDPTPFVDQKTPGSHGVAADLHLQIRQELLGQLKELEFPVVSVTAEQWETVKGAVMTDQGGFDYGLSVARLLEEKQANLFLSLSGYRDLDKRIFHFDLQFFNIAGQSVMSRSMELPFDSVEEGELPPTHDLLQRWLTETFEEKLGLSAGASLAGEGEVPPVTGIVILPAFEEGESPPSAFQFVDRQQRSDVQLRIAETLRQRLSRDYPEETVHLATPNLEDWRRAREGDETQSWAELLGSFDANSVLSIHGNFNKSLLTYGVELEWNQLGTIYFEGQHRFAFTEDFFREHFEEVVQQLLAAPILKPQKE